MRMSSMRNSKRRKKKEMSRRFTQEFSLDCLPSEVMKLDRDTKEQKTEVRTQSLNCITQNRSSVADRAQSTGIGTGG